MESKLRTTLHSMGMLRVSVAGDHIFELKVKSYYDKLELVLIPHEKTEAIRSPMQLFLSKSLMRGIFPDFSLESSRKTMRITGRAIMAQFFLSARDGNYYCVIPRDLNTYRMYRTADSLRKDEEQGFEP